MKTTLLTAAAVLGITLFGAASASAGGIYFSTGPVYGSGYYGGWGGYNRAPRGHYHYHNTSHYDYVPPRVVPHGNHYHYRPGGYIYHQQGHYDYHRGRHHHGHHHHH